MEQYVEIAAIKNLLDKYFTAVYKADIEALKDIFHAQAAMYGYLGDNAVMGTPEIFFADLSSKPSMESVQTKCTCVVDSIEVHGNIASASIIVDKFFNAVCVKDLFHLMKVEGKWRIMCKTFTTL